MRAERALWPVCEPHGLSVAEAGPRKLLVNRARDTQHVARSRCPAPINGWAVRSHTDGVVTSAAIPLAVTAREDEVVGDDPNGDADDEVKCVVAVVLGVVDEPP